MSAPQAPDDGNHALLVGYVAGALSGFVAGVDVRMIEDAYSNQIEVTQPSGRYLVTITRESAWPLGDDS